MAMCLLSIQKKEGVINLLRYKDLTGASQSLKHLLGCIAPVRSFLMIDLPGGRQHADSSIPNGPPYRSSNLKN
jgi:hypothetical protein